MVTIFIENGEVTQLEMSMEEFLQSPYSKLKIKKERKKRGKYKKQKEKKSVSE